MIKKIRLMEYVSVLDDAQQLLRDYESNRQVIKENIKEELEKTGGASLLKSMVEDYINVSEEKAFLAGLYYGTHISALINEPVVLPEEF